VVNGPSASHVSGHFLVRSPLDKALWRIENPAIVNLEPSIADGAGDALRRAFLWRWNWLMLIVGGLTASFSGHPAIGWIIVIFLELAYLGSLGLSPRFYRYLRGGAPPKPQAGVAIPKFQQLMAFLSPADAQRFNVVRRRCSDLLNLRRRMAGSGHEDADAFRSDSLDRMLWLFLKLLHQRAGLERFLEMSKRVEIEADLRAATAQLAEARTRDEAADSAESRLTGVVRERSATLVERLATWRQAADGLELVSAEIDKTEQQITHLCETGMTAGNAAALSAQLDGISASLQMSEKIFSETPVPRAYDGEPRTA
jgi:hypothetical protein